MPARLLTDALLRSLGPDPSRTQVHDTRVSGLSARAERSGEVTFIAAKMVHGIRRKETLGRYGADKDELSLKVAREKCLARIAAWQDGRSPAAEEAAAREAQRQAHAKQPTVAKRLREWQEAKDREWKPRYAFEVDRIVKREILPSLGKRGLRHTVRADWTDLVAAKRRTSPAMASHIYRVCAGFLNFAEASGWIDTPLLPRKGLATLAPPPERRERVLSDDELRRVWDGSAKLAPRSRALVRLLILTGARREEVADLSMHEIDVDAARWTIPSTRTKNGESYTIPLCQLALAELAEGGAALRGFSGFSKMKAALDAASGVTDWRLHDLRRTVRTGLSKLGVSREIAEACVNHISGRSGLVGTYDKHTYADEIIEALSRWQAHVAGVVSGNVPGGARVIKLRRA